MCESNNERSKLAWRCALLPFELYLSGHQVAKEVDHPVRVEPVTITMILCNVSDPLHIQGIGVAVQLPIGLQGHPSLERIF